MKKLKLFMAAFALLLGWSNFVSAQGWTASEVADGNFYLYNVGANAYLENGASWGTHAALKNGGFVVNVAAVDGGKYTIGTNSKYSDKFFTQNGYVDTDKSTNWTFEPVEGKANTYRLKTDEGYYAIAASGMYNVTFRNEGDNEAYWWKLVTGDNRNAGTNATYLTPVEWTHKINNPRFDDDNSGWNDAPARGGNTGGTNGNEGSFDDRNPCAEHFNKTYDTYQELTGLSNGVYAVSVQGFYREGSYAAAAPKHVAGTESLNAILYANNAEQPLMSIFEEAGKASGGITATATGIDGAFPDDMAAASYFFSAGLYWNTVYVKVTDGTLRIGVKKSTSVDADWTIFDSFRLQYYGNDCTVEQAKNAAVKKAWDDAYSAAVSARDNAAYENVVGAERTALNTEIAKEEPTTAEGYVTATQSLSTATSNFIAAAPNYDLLATEITKATALGMDASSYAATSSSTAASALTNTQNLKVAEYTYVTTTYPYAVALGEWTSTAVNTAAADFSNEHWSGTTHKYKNQKDDWGNPKQGYAADSWSINFNQDVTLPAGNYVFKVAGRQASGDKVTTSLVVKNGEDVLGTVSDFPRSNNSRGINKSGETAFEGDNEDFAHDGAGYGWEWRYVKFTLASDATVNIAVNSVATDYNQWVSFGDYTLQTDDDANIALITYNIALANAQTIIADGQYSNVTGSEKTALQAAIDADASLDKTDVDAIEAATTTLSDATTAFTGAKSAYDTFVAAKAVVYEDNLPYASSTKFADISTAQSATATSASDAESKTATIISAYRKYVESNALAEGVDGAESITISDPNMDVTYDGDNHKFGAWQVIDQTNGTIQLLSGESFTDGDGNSSYKYADIHKTDNNAGIQQTVNLNSGRYLLTATARANTTADATFWLFANDNTTNINRIGNSGGVFGRGWNDTSVEFIVANDDTDVNIGVHSGNGKDLWWSATRFRLVRLGDATVTITPANNKSTYVTTQALDFTSVEGLKAYVATAAADGKVTLEEVDAAVPAGTPLMLIGTADTKYTVNGVVSASAPAVNMFRAGNGTTVFDGTTFDYILYTDGLFYQIGEGTVATNKAYLHCESDPTGGTPGARALRISFGGITDVENIEAAPVATVKKNGAYLENGKIAIYKNGMKFSATGAKLK